MNTPLPPSGPLPRLTGCGIHTHVGLTRPDGSTAWPLADDVWLVETKSGEFIAEAPDLEPLKLDRESVVAAAAQVANYVAAVLHDARQAARILDDAIAGGDVEAAANGIANAAIWDGDPA